MVVAPDGAFTGTIGGGALEWGALAEAQALLARRDGAAVARLDQRARARSRPMLRRARAADDRAVRRGGPRGRRAAGARPKRDGVLTTIATVGSEDACSRRAARRPSPARPTRCSPTAACSSASARSRPPFYLFGAGPCRARADRCARAVAVRGDLDRYAARRDPGDFPVERHGDQRRAIRSSCSARAPDGAFVAVMTHSHALDLDLVIAALQADRFAYVGLIGSATKRARFTSAMRKMGMADGAVDRLVCPIGLTTITDKAPAAIAASVAAQVLIGARSGAGARDERRSRDRAGRAMADAALADGAGAGQARARRMSCRCSKPSASPSSTATSSPTTPSISKSGRPKCTRCSARTAPANRRW